MNRWLCCLAIAGWVAVACGDVTRNLITREQGSGGNPESSPAADAGGTGGMPMPLPDCSADVDCSDPAPRCDLGSNTCVGCLDNGDCAPPVDCTGEACDVDARLCHPSRRRCVECVTDGHCDDAWEQCSAALGLCAKPCALDGECFEDEPYCDGVAGFCVECRSDDDCDTGVVCRNSTCL